MILRKSIIRQGRKIASSPPRSWTRSLATPVETIEASLDNHFKETRSLDSAAQQDLQIPIRFCSSDVQSSPTGARFEFNPETDPEDRRVAGTFHTLRRQRNTSGTFGTSISPHYLPHRLLTDPPHPDDITLSLLLASQAHLGHSTSLWNPMNSRYIFGIRQGIHIISLDVTASHLRRACKVVSGVAERGGLILFAGTRPGQDRCVVKAAQMAGGCHLFERWTPGSITNGHQILGQCKTKIVDEFDRQIEVPKETLQDRPALKPDLVVCLNPLENWVLLHECGMNAIPTIGIIDTDANPTWVTYAIPANDDSLRCVQVIAGVLGRAAEEGQARRREKAVKGELTYVPERIQGMVRERKKTEAGAEM